MSRPQPCVRVVALDFDGVIVDSRTAKQEAYDDVFSLYPTQASALAALRSQDWTLNRIQFFERALGAVFGRPGDARLADELMTALSHAMVARVAACPEMPGVRGVLTALRGVPLYMISRTPQDDLRRIVRARGLESYFKDVLGCPPHTKVDALNAIVAREAVAAQEVFFAGDDPSDAHAAAEAGVPFAFTASPVGRPPDVLSFATMADLGRWVTPRLAPIPPAPAR